MRGVVHFGCGLLLVAGCGGGAGGANNNDVATAVARVKGGVEAQAPGLSLTAQAVATGVAPQLAGASSTAQAAATAVATQVAGAAATVAGGGAVVPSQALDQAKSQASQALGVPVDQVTVDRIEQVQWRDSSLGCAEAGKAYSQVVTPGVRVVLSGGGKKVEAHADQTGQRVVSCQNPSQ